MSIPYAEIHMWGRMVGALTYDPEKRIGAFEYAEEWLRTGIAIDPINLAAASGAVYQFPSLDYETYKGLPAVFADTLPDDFGNAVINAWLAREGRAPDTFTALDRLLYTHTRGMGALEYHPGTRKKVVPDTNIELFSLVKMAQEVLDQRKGLNENLAENGAEALAELLLVGTSAGGARPKAVIAINADRTIIRSGQADIPKGFEHFLLKFDGVTEGKVDSELFGDPFGFGRMEYTYYEMARTVGIDISHSELLLEGPRAHFMTQRFDRNGNEKLHYLSLCAIAHKSYKQPGLYSYEELFMLMRELQLPRYDAEQLVRRMVFNVVMRNQDDHTKNFGFLLPRPVGSQKIQWRLAPAFDVAYSYKKDSPWVSQHQMSINGKRDEFTIDDLIAASPSKLKAVAIDALEQTLAIANQWREYAKRNEVPTLLTEEIAGNLRLKW